MTPDPYHTPGYCGYVPQFKYRIGDTFGNITHRLLTDTKVPSSGNPVLSDTYSTYPPPAKTQEDFLKSDVYSRARSWGSQKYTAQMVPGYTGYIPQQLNHFGLRYAEICHNAIGSFEKGQKKYQDYTNDISSLSRLQGDPDARPYVTLAQNTTPMPPISDKAKPYLPAYAKQHSISPFYMPDGHPQQYYMAGYTGFIPKARKHFGQSYPTTTTLALREHKAEATRLNHSLNEPVNLSRVTEKVLPTSKIYPKTTGLVPHYTGHIPGQKFKFGDTFGSGTRDALPQVVN